MDNLQKLLFSMNARDQPKKKPFNLRTNIKKNQLNLLSQKKPPLDANNMNNSNNNNIHSNNIHNKPINNNINSMPSVK
jgi:hypothetical protein